MAAEIAEIPAMIWRQLDVLDTYVDAGRALRQSDIRGFVTCARGTSDHAATFFKYLMETCAGVPVASIGPSVASVYEASLKLNGFACLTFSQSGGSPDLAALQEATAEGGAQTFAILNVTDSPVGHGANHVLPVLAGPEEAVAATKSFVGMLVASLAVGGGYLEDRALLDAMARLPEEAEAALSSDWSAAEAVLGRVRSLFCVGRGPNLAIAAEAALKLKETCGLHAEAFSAAEVLHGPVVLAGPTLGALVFGTAGPAKPSLEAAYRRLHSDGARTFLVGEGGDLAVRLAGHDLLGPVLQAVAFYSFVERLSVRLGRNPDAPEGLRKVTETV
ncbi:MAG: SIS domain-containing protein [Rhodobacteraceae bacterium]|nr:SIS domain-containing protein [Paracoccaceae bacterium]